MVIVVGEDEHRVEVVAGEDLVWQRWPPKPRHWVREALSIFLSPPPPPCVPDIADEHRKEGEGREGRGGERQHRAR